MSHPSHRSVTRRCSYKSPKGNRCRNLAKWLNALHDWALCGYHYDQMRGDVPPNRTGYRRLQVE